MKAIALRLARFLQDWGKWLEHKIQPQAQRVFVGTQVTRDEMLHKLKEMATFFVDRDEFTKNFARGARHFIVRITGGCGLMQPEHAVGMENLTKALGGEKAGDPYFDGFGLFGASRMHRISDPSVIIPGVTEVLPAIHKKVKRAAILGVVAMTEDIRYGSSDTGILLSVDEQNDLYTVVHPEAKSILMVKPEPDVLPEGVLKLLKQASGKEDVDLPFDADKALWRAEYRQCLKMSAEMMKLDDYRALLIVYNGGGITEEELLLWATLGKADPRWQVLIVKGSGRKADVYANDEAWLSEHPTVHVAENTVKSIRSQLLKTGAIRHPRQRS